MESGRSTPVPMSIRPPTRRMTVSTSCSQPNAVSSARPQEQANTKRPLTPPTSPRKAHTPSCLHSTISIASNNTQIPQSSSVLQSLLSMWVGNIAAVQGCFLTTVGLGWAVYTRAVRFNVQAWMGGMNVLQSSQSKDLLSDFSAEVTEGLNNSGIRLQLAAVDKPDSDHNPQNDRHHDSSDSKLQQIHETTLPDPISFTHALLQKHFNYLMPWVSNQPCENDEETTSDRKIASELRRMSLQPFTELSTAIYRDVRRREQESSPDSVYAPKPWDQCMRNRQNESRMVLCRTINEQFYQLVLALVLEQARRLAEMRIRLNRRAASLKQ